ncbi:hypothetical protein [Caballeronia humi]|uniref:Uncharacterized protein n=1 Tax=Caballeronia humi TaxID=326474 RepID=A0A158JIN7_9BURK|nr:hypothetical protein [Caballeronia humi]SAL68694.1 hypothetical protein AWB65_06744 [Caballeronia humi]
MKAMLKALAFVAIIVLAIGIAVPGAPAISQQSFSCSEAMAAIRWSVFAPTCRNSLRATVC